MITITRTASIAPGKTSGAMAYSHQIAKYIGIIGQHQFGHNNPRVFWCFNHCVVICKSFKNFSGFLTILFSFRLWALGLGLLND